MVSVMSQSWCWPLKLNTGVGLRTQVVSEVELGCWWVALELQKVLTLALACCLVGLGSGRSWSQCRLIGDWNPVPGSLAARLWEFWSWCQPTSG